MCGIAGMIRMDGPGPLSPGRLRAMSHAIVHRGPDEDGVFLRPGLAMANRRLSIVGLKDGRQPLYNEDRSIAVVFNGELFDFPEVRANLSARGHQFRTHCDTELLPHLWEDYAEGMLEKLRGQFAFALWDENRQRLTLARDRFGICPLYWTRQRTEQGDILLFGSEIKALLASGLVPRRPNARGINHVFTFFALPGPLTCFEEIHCLLPGHFLSIDFTAGAVRERIYWEIDFPDDGEEEGRDIGLFDDRSAAPLVDEFEPAMQRA